MFSNHFVKLQLSELPDLPGCYIYRDSKNAVIYVGKAKNLKKRVSSYFVKTHTDPHINNLVSNISHIQHIVTDSELEAFILETNLIKKYKPYFNRDQKDDKNYIWIMIDKNEDFPRLQIVRSKTRKNAIYLGPYHYTMPVRRILNRLRKIYPYRTCNRVIKEKTDPKTKKKYIYSSDPVPCLYYHLGLCPAPCAGYISKKQYNQNLKGNTTFFTKGHNELVKTLKSDMEKYTKRYQFEKAAELRNKIQDLEYIKQRVTIEDTLTDETTFHEEKQKHKQKALNEIILKLDYFDIQQVDNFKIECFDISNIQGTNAVGSMIVFVDGNPAKNLYRKFKIKTKSTPDDFAMMSEMLKRRFLHNSKKSDDSFDIKPNLIIIDGGKGQLSVVYKVLSMLNIDIPVIGLAKQNEDIFFVKDNDGELEFVQRRLKFNSDGYFLLQRIRDESHRFAINYHRKLRSLGQTASLLDDIPGVGQITKKRLLRAFGSVEGIRKADTTDLQSIIKNKSTIEKIRKVLEISG